MSSWKGASCCKQALDARTVPKEPCGHSQKGKPERNKLRGRRPQSAAMKKQTRPSEQERLGGCDRYSELGGAGVCRCDEGMQCVRFGRSLPLDVGEIQVVVLGEKCPASGTSHSMKLNGSVLRVD